MNYENTETTGQVAQLLDKARRRLVEMGARNPLIHVNRNARRSNRLNIINERSDDVFAILRSDGRRMRFAATASEEDDEDQDDLVLLLPDYTDDGRDESRFTDKFLETPLTHNQLQKRLLKLARNARIAEEEQGVNILYLALGFLNWLEDRNSAVQREAPLILLPVELFRNERTSTYDLRCRDDDVVTNLPLQERLKTDFSVALPEIDDSAEWTPSGYFQSVRDAISGHSRWTVDDDGMQLGFFSFSKLLMLRDLDPENWPDEGLVRSELIRRCLVEGFADEPGMFEETARLDEILDPADLLHVVDADASQAKVIEEVRSGRNLVVQGPPGTGKSQTITNILAAAAHDGKTILFVAEKMAALQVVHRRMVDVELADLCLELHSKGANKKSFLQELAQTLSNGRAVPGQPETPNALKEARDELNRVADLLHTSLPGSDFSPFEAISEIIGFIGRDIPSPRLSEPTLADLSVDAFRRVAEDVREFAEALAVVGRIAEHPFTDVGNPDLQPPDLKRLEGELLAAENAIECLLPFLDKVARATDSTGEPTIACARSQVDLLRHSKKTPDSLLARLPQLLADRSEQFAEAVDAGAAWQETRSRISDDYSEAAWNRDVGSLRSDIASGVGSFLSRWLGGYRRASSELATLMKRPLPDSPRERLELLDKLMGAQRKRAAFLDEEGYLKARLGRLWRGERTDFPGLKSSLGWLEKARGLNADLDRNRIQELVRLADSEPQLVDDLSGVLSKAEETIAAPLERLGLRLGPDGDESRVPLASLRERFRSMWSQMDRYHEWARLATHRRSLEEEGLLKLVALLETEAVGSDRTVDEFRYATAEARWSRARSLLPELDRLSGMDRHRLVERFRELDRSRIADVRGLIRSRHLEQLPKGAVGEMGVIRGEIAKKRRIRPIRRLMSAAGQMVQRIKPVFMMSPISVAQFLPPGRVKFDLLVIDEASQVRPEEALGAIARAKQIVVVGDQKQLPPTSFFDRLADDSREEGDDDVPDEGDPLPPASVAELESVLTLCEARGLRASMLNWHYRSRDPSLIAVSNREFYKDRLFLPPTPLQMDERFGLKFTRVAGVYISRSRGRGRAGTNRKEADAVAKALALHARNSPDLSVGIVTFSKAQADMMGDVLELERRQDGLLDKFMREGRSEDVFVKNIENVQGDERDVILISVGYGPHEPDGRLASMNFGPVNSDGGERRLNVLFTRARVRCEVFASFDPAEIDLSRTSRDGPRILKRFLEFAKSGELDQRLVTGKDADSPFEEDVARAIALLGFKADLQVGSAGFRIDIAVRHPERAGEYVLAVECDGATYHRAIWARERDRLRQEVLEGLGWRFHRIWSTDWFHNRIPEQDRLRRAIDRAISDAEERAFPPGANDVGPRSVTEPEDVDCPPEPDEPSLTVTKYEKAKLHIERSCEPHEFPTAILCAHAVKVVQVEGPVHTDEVARRIAGGFGKKRAGSRIQDAALKALMHAERSGSIVRRRDFWFTERQRNEVPVRDRSQEEVPTTKPEYLSAMEITAAADMIRRECGHVETDDLVRAISQLLGYRRAGHEFQARVRDVLDR